MTLIVPQPVPHPLTLDGDAAAWWAQWAADIRDWLGRQRIVARDAAIVLPLAAHLPLARAAWAACGDGWLPRIGTVATLAAEAGGRLAGEGVLPTGDASVDVLGARALLLRQEWGRAWRRRDPRGFELGVRRVMEAAQAWTVRLAACPPRARADELARLRERLAASAGALARERMLALTGLEWAAGITAFRTDVLWAWQPAACVVVGGVADESFATAWSADLSARGAAVLRVEAAAGECAAAVRAAACADFEDEAQRAAAEVIVRAGGSDAALPVALVAQDRELVRRVRALLERQGLRVADETGWKLSTTRAGAALMCWLRAARERAGAQQLLDALRSGWGDAPAFGPADWRALEAWLAQRRRGSIWAAEPGEDKPGAAVRAWWQAAHAATGPLRWRGTLPLAEALQRLRALLQQLGSWSRLQADEAGAQVLAALRLDDAHAAAGDAAWQQVAAATQVDAQAFAEWADGCLELASFTPAAPQAPQVLITPPARAVLRPFAALVWPGADDEHLSPPEPPLSWLGARLLDELGLPARAQMAARSWAMVRLLLAGGAVALSWRHADGERLLQPAGLLQRWAGEAGLGDLSGLQPLADHRGTSRFAAAPTPAPLPSLRAHPQAFERLFPRKLSATGYEALRACPYRFHAQVLLGLREEDELEEEVSRRDFGNWLHEVLRRFHAGEAAAGAQDEASALRRLHEAAAQVSAESGWGEEQGEGDFLLHAAAFERMAPLYLDWWREQRSGGVSIARMEAAFEADLPQAVDEAGTTALPPVLLQGRLDRLDRLPHAPGTPPAWRIVDYKTSSKGRLQSKLKPPSEDTQMAFYAAALELSGLDGEIAASYLALEDREVNEVPHPGVQDSADLLLGGLASDLSRIAAGAAMPALGEGETCDWCSARGLCRRDHREGRPQ